MALSRGRITVIWIGEGRCPGQVSCWLCIITTMPYLPQVLHLWTQVSRWLCVLLDLQHVCFALGVGTSLGMGPLSGCELQHAAASTLILCVRTPLLVKAGKMYLPPLGCSTCCIH